MSFVTRRGGVFFAHFGGKPRRRRGEPPSPDAAPPRISCAESASPFFGAAKGTASFGRGALRALGAAAFLEVMYAPGAGAVRTDQLPQLPQRVQPQLQPQVDVPATLPQPHLHPQALPLLEAEPLTLPPEQAEQSKQKQHLPEALLSVVPPTLELCLQRGLQQD